MIIFDLDGTLANCEHRKHFVKETPVWAHNGKNDPMAFNITSEPWKNFKPDWDAFHETCDEDKPIQPVCRTLRSWMESSVRVEIWSGRSESVKEKTLQWLDEHVSCDGDYLRVSFFNLKMRPIGDFTPDDELKEKWLDEALSREEIIDFVFDDRPKVIRMWRKRGIFVFNCNQTDEEF